jgi:UPF0755 protein
VTESNPPPNGNGRAAGTPRALDTRSTAARSPAKPELKGRTEGLASRPPAAAAAAKAPRAPDPAVKPAVQRTTVPAQGARAASPPDNRTILDNPNGAAKPSGNAAVARTRTGERVTAEKQLNGRATAGSEPAAARSVAYSRDSGNAVPVAGEPYPPLSDLLVNGISAAPVDPKRPDNSQRITPRSPRTALEPDTIEAPPKRSKTARHPLVIIGNAVITGIIILAVVAGFALYFGKQRFEAPGPLPEDRVVNIPHGSGIRDIADVLSREGVIDQPWVFVGGVLVLKAREDLKAGEYQFKAHASLRDVVATIVEGKVVPHQISIPEGLTSEQIVARLMDDDVLIGNIKEVPREGTLLPDTYNFTRGVTREQMIQRMQQAQQRLVKEIWDRHLPDLPLKTPDQLVILASIVEKETGKPEERTRVAAVFVNRLKQKIKLQSDPTIIYGLVGGKGTLGRPIMKSEIEQQTPYNTYQIEGLPPGPICNPGRASLEAAANPARTRELYFVADGTGGHAFSETYEQHQRNVAKLRQLETDAKDQAPPDAQAAQPAAQAPPTAPARRAPAHHH